MGLFHFGKKKEEQEPVCACNDVGDTLASIKVLGSGCKACHELYENTKKAVKNAGLSVEVEYITDLEKVMEYGVMSMPGLVVNEKVVSMGKVLKAADVEKLLHGLGYHVSCQDCQ
ncbi:MAG: TM0996/MTH895 family glutaredoxin-like protein [Lachnospiraceae bacterium]|nr:TM0996/MTH895 family glutaredoxin-like protein [Lachnospiraceae bacterium]